MATSEAFSERRGDGAAGFDFLHGDWTVRHRRLQARLCGCESWDEFGGTVSCRPVLGGRGNVDDNLLELPGGAYRALTLRLYDPDVDAWTIHWVDGRKPGLDPPLRGGFTNGAGLFFGEDVDEGRPVKVRFTWEPGDGEAARWSQAFSADGGGTWETNWVMDFTRVAGEAGR